MIKFQINKFIELRLEDGKSNIYLDNQYFRQSKYIILKKTLFEIPRRFRFCEEKTNSKCK